MIAGASAPPKANRECGGCTFCCKVMEIHELQKPVGKWCPNCRIGKGCKIYGEHPPTCQDFKCQWLLSEALPENFRPDKTKVVLTAENTPDGLRLVANCDPADPVAWRKEPVYGWLKLQATGFWQNRGSVVAKAFNRLWLIGPNGDLDLGVVDQRAPVMMEQRNDGTYAAQVMPPVDDDQDVGTALADMRSKLGK